MEIWKPAKNYEQLIEVSNYGNVRTPKHNLTGSPNRDGYLRVRVIGTSIDKTITIHRLVATTFIDNPQNFETINHKDGNKQNNHVNNLEWCDRSYQMFHAYKLGLKVAAKGESNCGSKLTQEQVNFIRNNYKKGSRKFGSVALGNLFNVSHRTILNIIHNKTSY